MIYISRDTGLTTSKIHEILRTQGADVDTIEFFQSNSRITDYLLDNKYILRISKSILGEGIKQSRVESVSFAPKIHSFGEFDTFNQRYYYLISDYIEGSDLWSVAGKLTDEQKYNIGREIAGFLNGLHSISGASYDIGHYIPTIPNCKKTWKDGHVEYVEYLKKGLSGILTDSKSKNIISKAFDYIYENISALEYQEGAKLLHNDFHPKNIIIFNGGLAGVIDWECSQFGEADFELAHLFHWCIYPSVKDNNIELLLKSVMENLNNITDIPNIEKRLTIYQLEHELNQLIWHGKKQEKERVQRIKGWLNPNNKIYTLLEKPMF